MFDPREPYNDLPLVSSIYLELTPELNNLREEARVSIELLNYALKSLPNSEILLDTLALQEAKVSSNIENIRTTNDDLLRAVAFKDFNEETKAIYHYIESPMIDLVGDIFAYEVYVYERKSHQSFEG